MLKLIKNGRLYAPHDLGKKDLLISSHKIAYILDEISLPHSFLEIEVIDAKGKLIVPGFIDGHVHLLGGGGEGGYKTRTPEIQLSDITTAGVTTVVGCLGTDGTTRNMISLLAKARGLEEEGISTYIYTGSYQVPVKTIMEKIEDDLIVIDKVIGVGEIALSDHRSSEPTVEELKKIASAARVGGILSGKAGLVHIHVGGGKRGIDYLEEIIETSDIPRKQFLPTHMNRNEVLLRQAISYAKKGGLVDFTASSSKSSREEDPLNPANVLKRLLEEGVSVENITFSSDGQGSLPAFNPQGEFIGLQVGKVSTLYESLRSAILEKNIKVEEALAPITSNPARILKLHHKGMIEVGKDADIVLLDEITLEIDTVIAMGQVMVRHGEVEVKGTFEG